MIDLRPIPGAPGYLIDRQGSIYSTKRGGTRRLKLTQTRQGYLRVQLRVEKGCPRSFLVHRLVLYTFRGPPPTPFHECRHLDGVHANNACDNLVWGTHKENMEDLKRHGRTTRGERAPTAKLTEEQVMELRHLRAVGATFAELASRFGVDDSTAYRIAVGLYWSHLPLVEPEGDYGRAAMRGEGSPSAKLTEDKVREIRGLQKEGAGARALASLYGVTPTTIRNVLARKTWAHVPDHHPQRTD